jgi:CTP:molybdopterin cytidylyltransferase MocA
MSVASSRFIGVILAAGRGRRMGSTKQLATITSFGIEKPLVAAAYDAIKPICDDMVVVLGHEADTVAAALGDRLFHRATSIPDNPMFESIRAGLRMAQNLDDAAVVVLQPGDQPHVQRTTLDALVEASRRHDTKAVIPQFGRAGGHPALIPPNIAQLLIEGDCPRGLSEFWLKQAELCFRVAVNDSAVVKDIDTPADLQ